MFAYEFRQRRRAAQYLLGDLRWDMDSSGLWLYMWLLVPLVAQIEVWSLKWLRTANIPQLP